MAWKGEGKVSEADVTVVQFFRTGKLNVEEGRHIERILWKKEQHM